MLEHYFSEHSIQDAFPQPPSVNRWQLLFNFPGNLVHRCQCTFGSLNAGVSIPGLKRPIYKENGNSDAIWYKKFSPPPRKDNSTSFDVVMEERTNCTARRSIKSLKFDTLWAPFLGLNADENMLPQQLDFAPAHAPEQFPPGQWQERPQMPQQTVSGMTIGNRKSPAELAIGKDVAGGGYQPDAVKHFVKRLLDSVQTRPGRQRDLLPAPTTGISPITGGPMRIAVTLWATTIPGPPNSSKKFLTRDFIGEFVKKFFCRILPYHVLLITVPGYFFNCT
jgi:hypothetical protein